jgi:hypothetical protein
MRFLFGEFDREQKDSRCAVGLGKRLVEIGTYVLYAGVFLYFSLQTDVFIRFKINVFTKAYKYQIRVLYEKFAFQIIIVSLQIILYVKV